MLIVNAAAPSRAALGQINGLSQTVASCVRAAAPFFINSLFAFSASHKVLNGNLTWIVLFTFTLMAALSPWLLSDESAAWRKEVVTVEEA